MRDNNSGGLFLIALILLAWVALNPQGCEIGGGGADEFILLHEPTKDDEAFGKVIRTVQDMQSDVGKAIIDSKWTVSVLDDEAKDGNKQPLKKLQDIGVYGTITDNRRELLSLSSGKLIAKDTIPPAATGADVLSMMKARGKR